MRERGKQKNRPLQPVRAPVADRGAHNAHDGGRQARFIPWACFQSAEPPDT